MLRGVEILVEIRSLIEHLNIPCSGGSPVDKLEQRPGVRLQHPTICFDFAQDHGADGEHYPGRIETSTSKNMLDEPSMEASIPILKRVDVDKPEGNGRRGDNGI